MKCPQCDHAHSTVVESADAGAGVRHLRQCAACGERFATVEQLQHTVVMVVKRDSRREEFQREKLRHSLRLAARKRPLAATAVDTIVEGIESRLLAAGRTEVASRVIGEMAITQLKQLDPIAYIRFASLYRQFVSVDDMIDELAQMAAAPLAPPEQPRLFRDDMDRLVSGDAELPRAPTSIETARAAVAW